MTSNLRGLIFALAAFAGQSFAQPALSRGEQLLRITYDECARRAPQALRAEGFSASQSANLFTGFKEIHGAYIMCNVAPDNKVWVNIVVASTSNDAGVPGYQRQRLQAQMDNPNAPPATTLTSGVYRVDTRVGGANYPSVWTLEVRGSRITGRGEWQCCPGKRIDQLAGRIEGDRFIIDRDCGGQGYSSGCTQTYTGTITGNTITGGWSGAGASSDAGWTLYLR